MKKLYALLLAGLLCTSASALNENQTFDVAKNLDIFNSLFKSLCLHYVDTIPTNKIMQAGINGMLGKLDPYTNYIPEESENDFRLMTTGEYGGVGALISQQNKKVYVSDVYVNMPAQKAGLMPGDVFVSIDGERTDGKSTSDVSKMLRGIPGTQVKVVINRNNAAKNISLTITRDNIYLNPITYCGMMDDHIGYLHLSSFTEDCSEKVKKELLGLQKQGMTKLVLDLRDNPGGLITEAISVCSLFLPKGETVVSTIGKNTSSNEVHKTIGQPLFENLPLAILVNDGSASASEIVTGAIQDLDRGIVVGERTFGKGLVQGTYPVAYNGHLKVTIAKYYTPSGRCIQAIHYTTKEGEKSGAIPDSLTHEFNTRAGRKVRDGKGIMPDTVITDNDKGKSISYYLLSKNLVFDYATQYRAQHEHIAPISEFVVSDADLNDFKAFVKQKDFTYKLMSEDYCNEMIKAAKNDGYYEQNAALFDSISALLKPNLDADFERASKEIKTMLAYEIVKRYYYQAGVWQEQLKDDKYLETAINLLNDEQKYAKMLKP